jgi:ribose transport system substrate-binding protein
MTKISKKRTLTLVFTILLIAMMLGACGGSGGGASESSGGSDAGEAAASDKTPGGDTLFSKIDPNDEYVVVCCIETIEYWNAHRYAWKEAGKLFNVKTSWVGMTGDDVNEMSTLFDNAAAKSPAGIVVLGWDEGLAASINKAVDNGIPVVCFSGDVVSSNRDTWVGSDNHDIGYVGGKKYAESIGGKGKVAILSYPGKGLFDERQKGFEDAFAEFPDIEMVAIGNTETDEAIAVQAAKDILTANPDLNGFVCTDATGPMGAITAIEEAGRVGEVDVLGLDRDTALLERIKEGTVTGTIVQDDIDILYWSLLSLITDRYYSDAYLTSDNKAAGAKLTPNKIACAINYIDKNNVDYYLDANKKYLEAAE